MGNPKRYIAKISWAQIETQENPNGEFVLWRDYERLNTEINHLRDCLGDAHAHNFREQLNISCLIDRLKSENERLKKAGDAMHVALLRLTSGTPNWDGKVYWNWNAAKDGKATA